MSLGNWGQTFLQNLGAGTYSGTEYVRDYTHATRVFRSGGTYDNAPKLKFLFHTYFNINPQAYLPAGDSNFGVLVKEIKLPGFSFTTHQMNQYNRKRIVQSKIKYDAIDVALHDDGSNQINKMWEAYFKYYYNDSGKPAGVLNNTNTGGSDVNYNTRTQYSPDIYGNDDYGFAGGATPSDPELKKVPFFKNITIFGLNQHNFTAYTLINPIITNFSHDTYNYAEAAGTMTNRMTIDYEAVVYNYGNLDGREPGNIVAGFGDPAYYDREVSSIAAPGSNGLVTGQGGLVDASGGSIQGATVPTAQNANTTYASSKTPNLVVNNANPLDNMLINSTTNTPFNRNTMFNFPVASATPGPLGLAGSPTIGTTQFPPAITSEPLAGQQYNGEDFSNVDFSRPLGGPTNLT